MNGFALEGWALLGTLLAFTAAALLAGAAIGYFTASRDLEAERAKARAEGRRAALAAPSPAAIPLSDEEALAYYVRVVDGARRATPLFDQDAPSPAALAIELRTDR